MSPPPQPRDKPWWERPIGQWPRGIQIAVATATVFGAIGLVTALVSPEDTDDGADTKAEAPEVEKPKKSTTPRPPAVEKPPPARTDTLPESRAPAKADPVEADHRFFLATDDDAITLDTAIDAAIDAAVNGDPRPAAITRIYKRLTARNYRRVRSTGKNSAGANELASAASSARDAAAAAHPRRLVKARVDAQDARTSLTEEFIGNGQGR